jgi:hypothetical protein
VHDFIGNWAFINAKETPDLIWEDPHSWQNFPQVTLFIPTLHELSTEQFATLRDNLSKITKMKDKRPLIIVTSPHEISPELIKLRAGFKHYKANDRVSARVQAHFLLYHHKQESPFTHECDETKSLYFLPFSPGSGLLH